MMGMVSPQQIQNAACAEYLNGRAPRTREEWIKCANFWAFNIAKGMEEPVVTLMGLIFNCPLTKEELKEIAAFQAERK
jgi:hypothetical protein